MVMCCSQVALALLKQFIYHIKHVYVTSKTMSDPAGSHRPTSYVTEIFVTKK